MSQKRNVFARSLAVFEIVDRRTVRVDGASLHQQVLCNLIRCQPDVIDPKDVDLVDGTVHVRPLFETEIAMSARNIPHASDQRHSCDGKEEEEDISSTALFSDDGKKDPREGIPGGPGSHLAPFGSFR